MAYLRVKPLTSKPVTKVVIAYGTATTSFTVDVASLYPNDYTKFTSDSFSLGIASPQDAGTAQTSSLELSYNATNGQLTVKLPIYKKTFSAYGYLCSIYLHLNSTKRTQIDTISYSSTSNQQINIATLRPNDYQKFTNDNFGFICNSLSRSGSSTNYGTYSYDSSTGILSYRMGITSGYFVDSGAVYLYE